MFVNKIVIFKKTESESVFHNTTSFANSTLKQTYLT